MVIRITEGVIADPTKYITAEFIRFLLQRLMAEPHGREGIVDKIMLNTKLSIQSYQDEMWDMYILNTMKNHPKGYLKVFQMIDQIA